MAQDSDQIVIAAGGAISIANVGTTVAPDPADPLSGSFRDLGYASEDGVTFSDAPTVEAIMSWQKSTPTRRIVTGREQSIAFDLQQWNDATFPLAFGGGAWASAGSGLFRFDPPDETDALEEKCLVVDWADGDRNFRLVAYVGNVTGGVETNLTRTGEARLPITFEINARDSGPSWNLFSDDPTFAVGGS